MLKYEKAINFMKWFEMTRNDDKQNFRLKNNIKINMAIQRVGIDIHVIVHRYKL